MFSLLRRAVALTLFGALLVPVPAPADPAAPMEPLNWLVGTWNCATPSGTALSYKQTFKAGRSDDAILQSYTLYGSPFTGSISFDGNHYVYESQTKARGTVLTQHMTALPANITKNSFDFSGTVAAGGKSEKERWTGKLTAIDAYVDRAYVFPNGKWQQILEIKCKRV